MKIKLATIRERDLLSHWLTRFGINHTLHGFIIQTATIEDSLWSVILSAPRLNDGVTLNPIVTR